MFSPLMDLLSVCLSVCQQGVMQGTIPYLGTFLTDLVMMDTAMKDYTEVGHVTCVSAAVYLSLFSRRDLKVLLSSFAGWSDQL